MLLIAQKGNGERQKERELWQRVGKGKGEQRRGRGGQREGGKDGRMEKMGFRGRGRERQSKSASSNWGSSRLQSFLTRPSRSPL